MKALGSMLGMGTLRLLIRGENPQPYPFIQESKSMQIPFNLLSSVGMAAAGRKFPFFSTMFSLFPSHPIIRPPPSSIKTTLPPPPQMPSSPASKCPSGPGQPGLKGGGEGVRRGRDELNREILYNTKTKIHLTYRWWVYFFLRELPSPCWHKIIYPEPSWPETLKRLPWKKIGGKAYCSALALFFADLIFAQFHMTKRLSTSTGRNSWHFRKDFWFWDFEECAPQNGEFI
jgi:hypothetical protein